MTEVKKYLGSPNGTVCIQFRKQINFLPSEADVIVFHPPSKTSATIQALGIYEDGRHRTVCFLFPVVIWKIKVLARN